MNASVAALAAADDSKFPQLWREMEVEERNALPDEVRALCYERMRKLSPHIEASVKRAESAAREAPRAPIRRPLPKVWIGDAALPERSRGPVKGIIGPGELAVIYGPSGSGKTFLTADLSAHVAAAMPWRGRRTSGGLVVYVAAEAGASILRRFVAWRDRHIGDGREMPPLLIVTRGVNLLFPVEVEELMAELRELVAEAGEPLALVIFDTLSRSIPGGDENGPDMTRAVAAADKIRDELGAATLIVHHTGKDATKGARGSSALLAAADTMISVVDKVATIEKVRDGTAGETFQFALDVVNLGTDEDGDPITTCIATIATNAPASPRPHAQAVTSGVGKVALQALREVIDLHGERMGGTSTIPNGTRAATIGKWREQFDVRYGEEEQGRKATAVRKAFERGREALLKAEAIGISSPYVWLAR